MSPVFNKVFRSQRDLEVKKTERLLRIAFSGMLLHGKDPT